MKKKDKQFEHSELLEQVEDESKSDELIDKMDKENRQ